MSLAAPRSAGSRGAGSAVVGLRTAALLLGLYFLFQGMSKLPWLLDSGILAERLEDWRRDAVPLQRWYIDTVATPGVPLFARLVPLAELATGAALIVGFWSRLVAALAFAMVANFHFALGSYFSPQFFVDGSGLPVMGGLLALAINGARLPWSIRP